MLPNSGALNGLLLVAVVLCALSVVTSQHKARKLLNELQKEKEHAQQMEVEWGQLQLEQSTLATSARIEKIAAKQLQMQLPRSGQIRIVRIEPIVHNPLLGPSLRSPLAQAGEEAIVPSPSGKGIKNYKGANQQP